MNCPVCKTVLLSASTSLENNLPSRRCQQCGGQWIRGEQYFIWLERQDASQTPSPEEAPSVSGLGVFDADPGTSAGASLSAPGHDTAGVKLCPECGRFLTRQLVGRGVDFHIDRCASCGGIWLDADEWQTLKSRGLHDEIHFVFSAAWQAEVNRQQQQLRQEQRLRERLGPSDYEELCRVQRWLDTHSHRSELYAYILNQFEKRPAPRPVR